MEEKHEEQYFVNNAQTGAFITVEMPVRVGGEDGEKESIRLHYIDEGNGEPLLLIHSIGQSLYTWRNVFYPLTARYRVIALDLPGHGFSDRPARFAYSVDEMAELLKRFLDALGVESTHIAAFSCGAIYAFRLLSMYNEYVANIITLAPGGVGRSMPRFVRNIKRRFTAVFARNLYGMPEVRKMLDEAFYNQTMVTDGLVENYYSTVSDGLSREAIMYAVQNLDVAYTAKKLRPLEHEVLVLWGGNDRLHPPSGSVYYQGVLKNANFYLIKNAGHLAHEEQPLKFVNTVFEYIPIAYAPPVSRRRREEDEMLRAEAAAALESAAALAAVETAAAAGQTVAEEISLCAAEAEVLDAEAAEKEAMDEETAEAEAGNAAPDERRPAPADDGEDGEAPGADAGEPAEEPADAPEEGGGANGPA